MSDNARPQPKNRILSALPRGEYERLEPYLEEVKLPHGQILYNEGDRIKHVYFPSGAVISMLTVMRDGALVETGLVGREGVTGVSVVTGDDQATEQAIVQIPDGGARMCTQSFREEFRRGGAFHDIVFRYVRSLMKQVAQTAACNRLHTVEERLARWLLMCHDRVAGDEIALTQEFISEMLGVRRASVTTTAVALQSEGYIRYSRGHITVIDRKGLEEFACECYGVVRVEFERELGLKG